MEELIQVNFIVSSLYNPEEIKDGDDLTPEKFTLQFAKWDMPYLGEQIIFENNGELDFFTIIGKQRVVANGVVIRTGYVVERHGHHGEFNHIFGEIN